MLFSGEDIRVMSAELEENAPEGMKNSFYHGCREGMKRMQKEYWGFLMNNKVTYKEMMRFMGIDLPDNMLDALYEINHKKSQPC